MNRDFAEMLSALSAAGVEFLVVGAYAMAAHGWPRATGDIDLWVRPTTGNAARTLDALRAFGAPLFDLTIEDLTRTDTVFQIGTPPSRIDLLSGITGVDFDVAWATHIEVELGGSKVAVIGYDCLLKNKSATGRPKDQADVVWLMSGKPGKR